MDFIIELLADIEHQQWVQWASEILKTEKISPKRKQRWERLIAKKYQDLSEEEKEQDRVFARLVLKQLQQYSLIP